MTLDNWTAIDTAFADHVHEDDALRAAVAASVAAGLPQISVSPSQGKFLQLLARLQGASRILEIGTLAAYSTIWLARAVVPRGRVITLEADAKHAAVARDNIARAGLSDIVDVRLGKALDTLPSLAHDGPFDFTFIDADKPNIPEYFDWAVRLTRPRGVIVVDNVVRQGAVIDLASTDENVRGVRRFHEALATDTRVSATTIQTVGSKGHDGFTIALVNG